MKAAYYRLFAYRDNEFVGYANEYLHQASCRDHLAGGNGVVMAVPVADAEHEGRAVYTWAAHGGGFPAFTEAE